MKKQSLKINALRATLLGSMLMLNACASVSRLFNPFYETPSPVAYLGERNDKALNEQGKAEDKARSAFDAMGAYKRTHLPQPNNPVMQPAIVRLMWVPDHLNKSGDLVPAHYYYVKVKNEGWKLEDAFEMEAQLGKTTSASSVPFITGDELSNKN